MFDTFARLLSSVPTFLFPVFASYKALKTSDPALLTPWLMYWVVLASALLFESWFGFILVWIPFYAWIRLGFLLYLILPQTQGAKVLYLSHVQPFLEENEHAIDDFISSAHERAKTAGITYLKQAIELFKQHALGLPPKEPSPPATPSATSYAQSLLARFNLPSARAAYPSSAVSGASPSAENFYSLLASAVSAATANSASSTQSRGRDLSNSGTLIPPSVQGVERLNFITAQRERLSILMSALDKEATNISDTGSVSDYDDASRRQSDASGLTTRKSEPDFEKIDAESGAEEVSNDRPQARRTNTSGSWMPWSWGAKSEEAPVDSVMSGTEKHEDQGKSSGLDY